MRVETVVPLFPKVDGAGDVPSGLVGVLAYDAPPPRDGRAPHADGGDGPDEVSDDRLLGSLPRAVPDDVDGDVGGEDGAHVVLQVHELRRPLVLLRVADQGFRGVGFGQAGPRAPSFHRAHGQEGDHGQGDSRRKRERSRRPPAHSRILIGFGVAVVPEREAAQVFCLSLFAPQYNACLCAYERSRQRWTYIHIYK